MTRNHGNRLRYAATLAAIALNCAMTFVVTGCGAGRIIVSNAMLAGSGSEVRGSVHSGRHSVVGAHIYLYAASTSGYGTPSDSLLTSDVQTDGSGNFVISDQYTCSKGQQLYVVALGGDSGKGANAQSALMAGLGDCNTIDSSPPILINEVTTVATIYALAPFMKSASEIGTPGSNTCGLARAFASINKLADIATGTTPGPALPSGAVLAVAKVNTIADVLAACVDSAGGIAGDATHCGQLFSFVTVKGNTPTDTISALLAMISNPTLKVSNIFRLSTSTTPYNPSLVAAPADWTLSVTYTAGQFSTPSSTAIDSSGNIWVSNAGSNTITVLAQSGIPIASSPLSGNGLNSPSAIALDATGAAWVANSGGTTVSCFNADGTARSGSPFAVGASPAAIAVDPQGYVWIANSGNNSITKLSKAGATVVTITSQANRPSSIAIDTW